MPTMEEAVLRMRKPSLDRYDRDEDDAYPNDIKIAKAQAVRQNVERKSLITDGG